MQNTTNTRIQIPSQPVPGETHRTATITGDVESCNKVKQMIERIIHDQVSFFFFFVVFCQGMFVMLLLVSFL